VVSVTDHVTNYLGTAAPNNKLGASILNSLTTMAFKTHLDAGSSGIKIIKTNMVSQVGIPKKKYLFLF